MALWEMALWEMALWETALWHWKKIAECPCVCHRLNFVGVFNPVSVFDVDLAAYHTLFFWGLTVLLVD